MLLACNHIGYVDFVYGGLAANPSGRKVRFMAKRELFDHKLTGPLMRSLHHIEVDRGDGVASFNTGCRVPEEGRGRRDLPRGHDLPGPGAQGVQDRRGPDRGRGRRPPGAGDHVGHPADDDQGPPQGLLARQDHPAAGRCADAPDRRGPGRRDRRAAPRDVGDARGDDRRLPAPTSSRPAPGGSRSGSAEALRPSRRRRGWTPTRRLSGRRGKPSRRNDLSLCRHIDMSTFDSSSQVRGLHSGQIGPVGAVPRVHDRRRSGAGRRGWRTPRRSCPWSGPGRP